MSYYIAIAEIHDLNYCFKELTGYFTDDVHAADTAFDHLRGVDGVFLSCESVDGPYEFDDDHLLTLFRMCIVDPAPHLMDEFVELHRRSQLHPKMLAWEKYDRTAPVWAKRPAPRIVDEPEPESQVELTSCPAF